MKLLMTMQVNGKKTSVFGTDRKDCTSPVKVNIDGTEHTFENVMKFFGLIAKYRVTEIKNFK